MFENYFEWLKNASKSAQGLLDGSKTYGSVDNTSTDNVLIDLMDMFGVGTTRRMNEFNMAMSNTAYQRAFKDMQAAGINPAMVFQNGSGAAASSPTASYVRSSAGSKAMGAASLINSAANLARSFNFDKNVSNNVGPSKLVTTIVELAKLVH